MDNGEKILFILNGYTNQMFYGNLNRISPIEVDVKDSVTIVPTEPVAFNLKAASSSWVYVESDSELKNAAVVRVVIPYATASRMSEDKLSFQMTMGVVVNEMLKVLTLSVGSLNFRDVSIARPGTPGEYFRDLDYTAGFELRMFASERKS